MDKKIPVFFDSVVVSSPLENIINDNPNLGRLKVRVFTKYANRNGSYITDQVADQLIKSATEGNVPVIGFFDPETKAWASHTGPTLANAYGYVENFIGWEPFTDTDGVQRDYAVFSVVLFTNYFEEAQKILGENQSMELDPTSITGDWARISDEEYFVYKTAKMLGFCVIGSHEPCFSVSSFFAKDDDTFKNQYEKFSSLLSELKAQVEEAEKSTKGGEQPMDEFEKQETVEVVKEVQEPEDTFQVEEKQPVSEEITTEPAANEFDNEESNTESNEQEAPNEYEQQLATLQATLEQVQNDFAAAQARISELESAQAASVTEMEALRTTNEQLQASLQTYEAIAAEAENTRKNELVEKYEKIITDAEKISEIKESVKDFSYDELESKLAIIYANQQMADSDKKKVPLLEPQESQFALLMKKYRK